MRNEYFGQRHGHSNANALGLVVSQLKNGVKREYSLTLFGRMQVAVSAIEAKSKGVLGTSTLIYCSPFSRCRKSAMVTQGIVGAQRLVVTPALGERNFGELELGSDLAYQSVWDLDAKDANHNAFGVESVTEVYSRMAGLISALENQLSGERILLVSHGDPLQILRAHFLGVFPGLHRTLPNIETGSIFRLA